MAEETPALSAEIVTTGTEILLGEIVDTNATWIAQQLRESGINLYYKTTVGDNRTRLRGVIELGLARGSVLLVTGGLGPTKDDITRDAIADATSRPLELNESALETLKERFARFGARMTENNRQQAYIPAGATLVENPVGTAPGFIVETGTGTVIAMPGVPTEMKRMMQDTVLPYLRDRNGNRGIIRRRMLRTIGIGESTIDHELGDLMERSNPTVGLSAHLGQADVRVTAQAQREETVEALLDEIEAEVRSRIGRYVYSTTPNEPFAQVVARLMQDQNATVALFETNTEGSIAQRLSAALSDDSPPIIAWTADNLAQAPAVLRTQFGTLQLPFSEADAIRLAHSLRDEAGASYGLAVIGTRGDDEGVWGREEGQTLIVLVGSDSEETLRINYGGRGRATSVRLGNSAMTLLWRALGGGQEQ
jgi:nicotinamide-nucleotide amidase